jgi:Tripartite tricarboxylate transporter family receptor
LGEHVTSGVITYVAVAEHLKDGKLRALATASLTRIEPLPDVPAVAESGYKDYEAEVRLWLFAPAKTPKEAVSEQTTARASTCNRSSDGRQGWRSFRDLLGSFAGNLRSPEQAPPDAVYGFNRLNLYTFGEIGPTC